MWMGDSHFCESPIHSISGSQKQKIVNQGITEMWSGIHIFFSVYNFHVCSPDPPRAMSASSNNVKFSLHLESKWHFQFSKNNANSILTNRCNLKENYHIRRWFICKLLEFIKKLLFFCLSLDCKVNKIHMEKSYCVSSAIRRQLIARLSRMFRFYKVFKCHAYFEWIRVYNFIHSCWFSLWFVVSLDLLWNPTELCTRRYPMRKI
jgi:hypothetical protein